jgi:hypothetical protein
LDSGLQSMPPAKTSTGACITCSCTAACRADLRRRPQPVGDRADAQPAERAVAQRPAELDLRLRPQPELQIVQVHSGLQSSSFDGGFSQSPEHGQFLGGLLSLASGEDFNQNLQIGLDLWLRLQPELAERAAAQRLAVPVLRLLLSIEFVSSSSRPPWPGGRHTRLCVARARLWRVFRLVGDSGGFRRFFEHLIPTVDAPLEETCLFFRESPGGAARPVKDYIDCPAAC